MQVKMPGTAAKSVSMLTLGVKDVPVSYTHLTLPTIA